MTKKTMLLGLLAVILAAIYPIHLGCSKVDGRSYRLEYAEIEHVEATVLHLDNRHEIIVEKRFDGDVVVFLFKDNKTQQIRGGLGWGDRFYDLGVVSIEDSDRTGIDEVQVFGKKAAKIRGILGANYAQAFYVFVEETPENAVIQVDGNAVEIDLDGDGLMEIVSTTGTIPETKIFETKDGKVYSSDINKSMGARSVLLQAGDENLFQVYFKPNEPEWYVYDKGSLIKR